MINKDFVELRVHGVAVDSGDGLPVVLLLDEEGSAGLPLAVGPFEASAIIIELEGIAPPRPLTHDLLAEFFRDGGLVLERAELFGDRESSPQARLIYRRGFLRKSRDVRPSDAVALAIRLKAPICAERALLDTRAKAEAAMTAFAPDPDSYFIRTDSRLS